MTQSFLTIPPAFDAEVTAGRLDDGAYRSRGHFGEPLTTSTLIDPELRRTQYYGNPNGEIGCSTGSHTAGQRDCEAALVRAVH